MREMNEGQKSERSGHSIRHLWPAQLPSTHGKVRWKWQHSRVIYFSSEVSLGPLRILLSLWVTRPWCICSYWWCSTS